MRAVADGIAPVDATFATFMDLCLVCRACEDVCPSHVPFGRMMERARDADRAAPRRGLHGSSDGPGSTSCCRAEAAWVAAMLQPVARPFMSRRVRALAPGAAA